MADYFLIFTVGLLGGLHCLGMCGGLIMACSLKFGGGLSFSLTYNAGRITSYVVLGSLMGYLGKLLIATGLFGRFQSVIPVLAGVFMVLIGIELLGIMPARVKRFFSGLFPVSLMQAFTLVNNKKKRPAAFFLGMANGLIPCGLLYAAGMSAAATADPVKGALIMASLGAGTLLPLLFAGSFSGLIARFRTGALSALSGVMVIALGLKSIVYSGQFMDMLMKVSPHCTLH